MKLPAARGRPGPSSGEGEGNVAKRWLYGAVLGVGLLGGAPWAVTQAVWTDAQSAGGNAFSTGSVDISTSPASAFITFSSMVPEDKATASITAGNDGTMQLRYAIRTTIAGSTTLSDGLTLAVKSGVTTCTSGGFGADGTELYTGSLTNGAVGSNAQGAQSGDRILSAGASEALCFQVELPSGAANGLQSLSTTATFLFDAEQTSNNP